MVMDVREEVFQHRLVHLAHVLAHRLRDERAEGAIVHCRPRKADNGVLFRHTLLQGECVEGGIDFLLCKVAGGSEENEAEW